MNKETVVQFDNTLKVDREFVVKPDGLHKFTLEPTDIVIVDGSRYRLVDRKAKVGEKVIIVDETPDHHGKVGEVVFDMVEVASVDIGEELDYFPCVFKREYRVLVPVEVEATADSLDLLANLARRVTSLESQLRDTQGNVEKLAQELAMVKNQTDCNEGDIAMLDERVIAIEKGAQPVTINTQNVTVNKDADIRKIAQDLARLIERGGACR
jgi:hypothetical protein